MSNAEPLRSQLNRLTAELQIKKANTRTAPALCWNGQHDDGKGVEYKCHEHYDATLRQWMRSFHRCFEKDGCGAVEPDGNYNRQRRELAYPRCVVCR